MKLDGYSLTEKLQKARRKSPLTATEQALYHELVAICNDVDWQVVFIASNFQLCSALQITEKTLINARNSLIQAGLIFYKSGKSKRAFGRYSFLKSFATAVKIPVETTVNPTGDTTADTTANPTANAPDFIETKTETETKPIVPAAPPPPVVKNSSGKEKDDKPEEHWAAIVAIWFAFNKEKFGDDPSFTRDEPKILKRILQRLKKRAEAKSVEWTEQTATARFKNFLDRCYADQWLSTNFLLNNLEKQFDKIILNHNGNKHQGATSKTISTGRSIVRDAL